MATINVSKVGSQTKSVITDGSSVITKYGGTLIGESSEQITIEFEDNCLGIFVIGDFTNKYGQTTTEGLADYFASNNFFVSASSISGGGLIRSEHIFSSNTERDNYFSDSGHPERLLELFAGLDIISGAEIQTWIGANGPSSYVNTNWHSVSGSALSASQIKTLYESNDDTNPFRDSNKNVLDKLSIDGNNIRSSVSIIVPAGSIFIGDSVIESGGRIITAKSNSTGNQGAFLIQLIGENSFLAATVFSDKPQLTVFDIQTSDDSVNSDNTEHNIIYDVQSDALFRSLLIKPVTLPTSDFSLTITLSVGGEPIVDETFSPSALSDQTNGVYKIDLPAPPAFDDDFTAYISFEGIALKGGAFDGSDGIRTGDSSKGNFFPWIQTSSIPIDRKEISHEDNVVGQIEAKTGDDKLDYNSLKNLPTHTSLSNPSVHNLSVNVPHRVDLNTVLPSDATYSYSVTNYASITSLGFYNGTEKLRDLTLPTSDGVQNGTIDLSGIVTSSNAVANLRIVANTNINSNTYVINIRDAVQSETLYTGVLASGVDIATVSLSSLTSHAVVSGTTINVNFDLDNGERAVIISPNDLTLTIVNPLFGDVPITDSFTFTASVRTESSVIYNSYDHANNSGVSGEFRTKITTR